jgi:Arc/MetJ family transcription regulator
VGGIRKSASASDFLHHLVIFWVIESGGSVMRATVALDDELVRRAQELTGTTERSALLRDALRALIHLEASRRLAAVGGSEPELEDIKRLRASEL